MLDNTTEGAQLYTDEAAAYRGIARDHIAVQHSVGKYVEGQAHTNGMESFWAMMKRGYHGVYHQMSPKHLQRYVCEFEGRHNDRPADTIDQMTIWCRGCSTNVSDTQNWFLEGLHTRHCQSSS